MDLFDVARITAKRWYVFIPLALITAFFAYQAYSGVKPQYYTSVSVGLVSPSVKDVAVQSSPSDPVFQVSNGLQDAGGVSLLANLLSIGLRDASVQAQVRAAGGSGSYSSEVFNLPNAGQLPIVVVSSQGPSAQGVFDTVNLVAQQAEPTLRGIQAQAGVPDSRLISAFPLSAVPEPVGGLPGRTRETATLAVAGLAGAVVASVLFDAVVVRIGRSRRKDGRGERDTEELADDRTESEMHLDRRDRAYP